MRERSELPENVKELAIYRRLFAVAGIVYLLWWFAVEWVLPNSFNPFISRILVVLSAFGMLALSYFSEFTRRHLRLLFIAEAWLITAHYYYLFYGNAADINWIVGSYITVLAVTFCLFSVTALLAYSFFVILLSLGLVVGVPSLIHSVFFLGLVTILLQANVGLRSRLSAIKNLGESNNRFQLLFNSTFEGVLVHENGLITSVNNAVTKIFGFSQHELVGRKALDVIHPEERTRVAEKIRSKDSTPYETKGYTKAGKAVDIEVRGKEFLFNERAARMVTIQEISDRKRAEKERIAVQALAENIRVRDEFISIVSHELKTPLSSLMLQVQIIGRDAKKGLLKDYSPEQMDEFLAIFNRQVSRLTELVETMLDVSHISSGRLLLQPKKFDLSALVRDVLGTLQTPNMLSTSPLSIELPEGLMIYADEARVEQVVENLVMNAFKYGEGRPIVLKVWQEENWAVLMVKDQGLGIAPEFIEKIFQRFERAISAQNISGLGLGLYITKQIVEAHGGRISVDSALGSGSQFTVHLPLNTASS